MLINFIKCSQTVDFIGKLITVNNSVKNFFRLLRQHTNTPTILANYNRRQKDVHVGS